MADKKQDFLLYRKVELQLENMLKEGVLKKGGRIPGERQLSEMLSVSRGTLRNALEELEKRQFLLRVPGKGTYIQDKGMTVRNIRIGYIFPEPEISLVYQNYGNYAINSEVWRGIMQCCAVRGITASFIPVPAHGSQEVNRKSFERIKNECSGVILPSREFTELAELLAEEGFPFCFTAKVPSFPHVFYDVEKGVTTAAGKLLACGCRSVKLFSLESNPLSWNTWETKVKVFKREFAAAGFPIPEENIIELSGQETGILEKLRQALPENVPLPDSIFTATPIISFALLHIATERHWKLPEDVQIMGYANNMNMRRTIPLLTHIELPHAAIGAAAVDNLAECLFSGRKIPEKTILEATLIQGETTI